MRLNRFLARCGLGSRRSVERLILEGHVALNGTTVQELSTRIDPERDRVEVNGRAVRLPDESIYLMLNKPAGCDVTRRDPHAKDTVFDRLPADLHESVQPVGRLDRATTGLLLLTNDGDLLFRLSHPRYEVEKEYIATGSESPSDDQIHRLLEGVDLDDGSAKAIRVERVAEDDAVGGQTEEDRRHSLRIVMHQGRKRIVRRMCDGVGFPLDRLHRVRVGSVRIGKLTIGSHRSLTAGEVHALRDEVGLTTDR